MRQQEVGREGILLKYKDRTTGLVVFGALQIALGGLCALMVPVMIFGAVMARSLAAATNVPQVPVGTMVATSMMYLGIAVWFLWMGIGSMKTRRWARALTLVVSWIWLVGGSAGWLFFAFIGPRLYGAMGKEKQIPLGAMTTMRVVTLVVLFVIYVLIPLVLVLFYGSRDVKATCERRDQATRWTDRCPLPVLALALIFASWVVFLPLMGFYGWVIPAFGTFLTGLDGALAALSWALLAAWIARGLYRLNMTAWWLTLGFIVTWGVSAALTFSRQSLGALYEKMHIPLHQALLMRDALPGPTAMGILTALFAVAFICYLVYIKRYFGLAPQSVGRIT